MSPGISKSEASASYSSAISNESVSDRRSTRHYDRYPDLFARNARNSKLVAALHCSTTTMISVPRFAKPSVAAGTRCQSCNLQMSKQSYPSWIWPTRAGIAISCEGYSIICFRQ